jgi:uncharacterized protein YjbI with pentapeptide repeats
MGLQIDGWFSLESSTFAKQGKDGNSVNLNAAKIKGHVSFEGAMFKVVDLVGVEVGGQFRFNGAKFDGKLNMNSLEVTQHLLMGGTFVEVELISAKVGGQLSFKDAKFDGKLDMNGLEVTQALHMGGTFKEVELINAKVGGELNFEGAKVDGKLNMNGLNVTQVLHMAGTFKEVDLINAKVGSHLNFRGANCDGKLDMNGLEVTQALHMAGTFKEVDLINAKVAGQINFRGATVNGKLDMNGLDVDQALLMRGVTFEDVDLTHAKVGGQLNLNDATFNGNVNIDNVVAEADVCMSRSTFNKPVSLLFARVMRNFDLSSSELTGLDLSGTRIEGEFRLGADQHSRTRWRKGAGLNLRNVHVGTLQDRRDRVADPQEKHHWRRGFADDERWEDCWPDDLQLDGFTYDRLGGFGGTTEHIKDFQGDRDVDMHTRDVRWYIDWLARDHSYSPEPYNQLADVFQRAGEPTKSNRILYASRRRARKEAWEQRERVRWFGSLLLAWTIGYGIGRGYFRALWWVAGFTAVGALLLYFSGQPNEGLAPGLPARFVYSLDQLLPIVEFEKYDKVVLKHGLAYYFYAQKLVGWVLGSFLVAGLAGLTQKQ